MPMLVHAAAQRPACAMAARQALRHVISSS